MIDVIYCAAGNRKFAEIAKREGFLLGAQLPNTVYFPIYFADQNWKKPNRDAYMKALAKHRPFMASVIDYERPEQYNDVIAWAEDAAQYVDCVMLIPKVIGSVQSLPRIIGGKPVRIGYSVPTNHGGTECPIWEFYNRPVHLLGGSPQAQMRLYRYLPNIVSVDGNIMQKLALQFCMFWVDGTASRYANNKYWPTLREANNGIKWNNGAKNAPYEAFRRSCANIMNAWRRIINEAE